MGINRKSHVSIQSVEKAKRDEKCSKCFITREHSRMKVAKVNNENGCEGILEMESQNEVEELEEDRKKKLLCLWLSIRNYKHEYVTWHVQLHANILTHFKYYLYGKGNKDSMIEISLDSQNTVIG